MSEVVVIETKCGMFKFYTDSPVFTAPPAKEISAYLASNYDWDTCTYRQVIGGFTERINIAASTIQALVAAKLLDVVCVNNRYIIERMLNDQSHEISSKLHELLLNGR